MTPAERERIGEAARVLVSDFPELTEDQRAQLRELLRGYSDPDGAAAAVLADRRRLRAVASG